MQQDKHVAEITHLLGPAAGWPAGLRWIVRRTKSSRRQARNLTAFERATGWRYSIIVTNIPATGIPGVPGSHHPQFTDVLHRQHAVVEDQVRTNKAMGLYNLPSKTWAVNRGWVLAANIAADLAAWCRLLGLYDCEDLKDAEPGTLRRAAAEPARPAGPPRPRPGAEDQPHLALERGLPGLLAPAVRPARTRLTSHPCPCDQERRLPGAVGAGAQPEHIGQHRHPSGTRGPDKTTEHRHGAISNQPRPPPDVMKERASAPGGCWKVPSIRLHQAREAHDDGSI